MRLYLLGLLAALLLTLCARADEKNQPVTSASEETPFVKAGKAQEMGNFKEALALYEIALVSAEPYTRQSIDRVFHCLNQLNLISQFDELAEKVGAARKSPQDWPCLEELGAIYTQLIPHYGQIIDENFRRGRGGEGGRWVDTVRRDRVRGLQFMQQAAELITQRDSGASNSDKMSFYLKFANLWRNTSWQSWQMQLLTDLDTLPGYDENGRNYHRQALGAPVDVDGNPVYYSVPQSFVDARNDGERWRWCLQEADKYDPFQVSAAFNIAEFAWEQFGVQTLSYLGGTDFIEEQHKADSIFNLDSLQDNQTVARLASGVSRFTLAPEYAYIVIYKDIFARLRSIDSRHSAKAAQAIASIYENRRQFAAALEWWKNFNEVCSDSERAFAQAKIDQIIGAWGCFENGKPQPAGMKPSVYLRFRNGQQIKFTAKKIKYRELIADTVAYIKKIGKNDTQEWWRRDINNIGQRLLQVDGDKYIGEVVAEWDFDLTPHLPQKPYNDAVVKVEIPEQLAAGGYLLEGQMVNGNTSRIVVWLTDTIIVHKPVEHGNYFYFADDTTGQPLPGMSVRYFAFATQWVNDMLKNQYGDKDLDKTSDGDGLLYLSRAEGSVNIRRSSTQDNPQFILTASKTEGQRERFACLGLQSIWQYGANSDDKYLQDKTLLITDRPVYRPGDTVKVKGWMRQAQYELGEISVFAGTHFNIWLQDPRGQHVTAMSGVADTYGGVDMEYSLPADAPLGVWALANSSHPFGRLTFRVEEYKKPEFEVLVDAPAEPVRLGDKFTATIEAKYYYGQPVKMGIVRYKVYRTTHNADWFPAMPWDWLYGRGYWWFADNYLWYPGWDNWGCFRPVFSWWGWNRRSVPQELVAEHEAPIGEDGTLRVVIDTASALELHPDLDHKYEIKVEVTDESRRTIDGSGVVLAARKPFSVIAWVDRGYYSTGEQVKASFVARTPDGKPVAGKGSIRLNAVSYIDGKPVERAVNEWTCEFPATGTLTREFIPPQAGQYRLSCTVRDTSGQAIEGGYIFTVRGAGDELAKSQFNHLEIIPQKSEYAPGDTCRLQINTRTPGAAVLLSVRCNNKGGKPQILRRNDKSGLYEFLIEQGDMPNIFVEGICAAEGEVSTVVRQIAVPPQSRVLNMELRPAAAQYKPAQTASITVRLTDLAGKPFTGQAVVTMYDKSVEYISGGSNVPEIKDYFWGWKRNYTPQVFDNLQWHFSNMLKDGEKQMQSLGIFGHLLEAGDATGRMNGARYDAIQFIGMEHVRRNAPSSSSNVSFAAVAELSDMAPPSALSGKSRTDSGGFDSGGAMAATPPTSPVAELAIRSNFADTAYWTAGIITDKNGEAVIEVPLPNSLTTWKIRAWAMGQGTRVGQAESEIVTSKDVIIRLQSPRFFTEGDVATITGNIHNYVNKPQSIKASIVIGGSGLELAAEYPEFHAVDIPAGGEVRVDWLVRAVREGTAELTLKAAGQDDSDGVRLDFPVQVHGMRKLIPQCGVMLQDKGASQIKFTVPEKRRIEETRLEIRYSPTLALAMVDALPYLCEYPYGCTEQTLNKFLPLVVTQGAIKKLGVKLADVRDKLTNLNSQEMGNEEERTRQWGRDKNTTFDPYKDGSTPFTPVFDEDKVRDMVEYGVKRLTAMQCSDGGWGWFSGHGESSWPHTTCTVIRGLLLARQNGVLVPGNIIDRGISWLWAYQDRQVELLSEQDKQKPHKDNADNIDALVYATLADDGKFNPRMRDYLYRDRNELSVYSKALFAWGLFHETGKNREQLEMLLQNLSQYIVRDQENQTAYLNFGENHRWWYWYGSEIEAMATYLKLLVNVDAQNPVASEMVKYLLNNRKNATYWSSTRDTALCIEAFAAYLEKSGETKPDMTVDVLVDGKVMKTVKIDQTNIFTFDNKLVLEGKNIGSGEHTVELRRKGTGPLYFNAYLSYFSLEDFITAAGLEIKTGRRVYRLEANNRTEATAGSHGQVGSHVEEHYKRVLLKTGDAVKSGELLEVELIIDSKNDYEYLFFEDMKAAGTEPVSVQSGYDGNALGAFVEYRDNRVCFFVRSLRRGTSAVSYRVRAVYPGSYSALPSVGQAMYAPELRGNSDEFKLRIDN